MIYKPQRSTRHTMIFKSCASLWLIQKLLLDNVLLQTSYEREELTLLFLRHFELIERGGEMPGCGVPVCLCDAESRVCCLHFPSGVNAWSTCGRTKLIQNVLANPLLRIGAVADEEFLELFVRHKPSDEIVNHGGKCVVTADTFVERLFLGAAGDREQQRKGQ